MEKQVTISQLIQAISRLPSDPPVDSSQTWYRTQKEHWLGWLGDYEGPGAYKRKTGVKRDAKYAYNHIVCPELLMYLIRAISLKKELVEAAEKAYQTGSSQMEKSGAIRKAVPWSEVYRVLWGEEKPSLAKRVKMLHQRLGKRKQPINAPVSTSAEAALSVLKEHSKVQNRALSVRQPHAEQILRGTKNIEYRSTATNIRGRVYIYASQTADLDAFNKMKIKPDSLPIGVIVGTVEIVGCSNIRGKYEWHLAFPERLEQPIKPANHPQPVWFKPFDDLE